MPRLFKGEFCLKANEIQHLMMAGTAPPHCKRNAMKPKKIKFLVILANGLWA
jgi:hypothetical protein